MSIFTPPGQLAQPSKVCPRCSTISQTDTERCPSCGKGYRRRSVALTVLVTLIGIWLGLSLLSWLAMTLISPS